MLKKIWKKLSTNVIAENKYWKYLLVYLSLDGKTNEYHYVHTESSTMW